MDLFTDSNIISFEPNRRFKSKLLSLIVEAVNSTAVIVLLFTIIDMVLGFFNVKSDIFAIEGVWDILSTLITMLFLHLIANGTTTTRVDVQAQSLRIQNPSTFSIPIKKNISTITRIEVHPNLRWEINVNVIFENRSKLSASIKDYTKFVTLLQEINPEIEVEYKE
jgi:hypothetical protein